MGKIRFAPIIRVSTEQQSIKGESLRTQTTQINQYVESLQGVIPKTCWQYSGQEHATPDQERQRLDRLLNDSSHKIFDAVIVCDASRWSRDNLKSKEGLQILRNNNIRFFIGTMEYDLYNPDNMFYLGMSAEIGEMQAMTQALKSITNRIHRARRGIPTAGRLPYGRTYSEAKAWGIDLEKQKIVEQAAKRYLSGETIVQIADTFDMNFTNLWKIINHRCGNTWECHFENKKLNIDETVILEIPELLDKQTISAVQERGQANKTYKHGVIKHHYLLSRMIFCKTCGYVLSGYTNHSGLRYYRHAKYVTKTAKAKDCKFTKMVKADELEGAVLVELVKTFGDSQRINKAIKDATPDIDKLQDLENEKIKLTSKLKQVAGQKENLIDVVASGLFKKEEIEKKINKIREQEQNIENRISIIDHLAANMPNAEKRKKLSQFAGRVLKDAEQNSPKSIFTMPYALKRKLVENAFGGKDAQGNRLGVYMEQTEDPEQSWQFEIRGLLENTLLGLPLTDEYIEETFKLDHEYQDIDKEIKDIRNKISSLALYLQEPVLPGFHFQKGIY